LSDRYDACIVGGGIGGLTCGAFLTRAGMKVLVLEKHIRVGGYADSFKRRKYFFESSIHSVPMAPDGLIMHLLRLLGVDKRIEPVELPEMFSMTTPDLAYALPARKEDILEYFHSQFPDQKDNIATFLREAASFSEYLIEPRFTFEESYKSEDVDFVSKYHNSSYESFINRVFSDEKLRLIFASQWPYVGSSPDYAPCLFSFMMFLVHFFEGSHTCKNGFKTLAEALVSVITDRGGLVKTRSQVTEMVIEDKRVTKILTENEEYEVDLVVSNISPYNIHFNFINDSNQSERWKKRLTKLCPSTSCVIVYMGMRPGFLPLIPHTISFWYETSDFNRIFTNILQNRKDTIDHLISLKSSHNPEYPTLTLMNFVQKSFSADWKKDKMVIAERMIDKVEELYPGIKEYVDIVEVASPTTFERYTANTDGALYGFENSREMYKEAKMPIKTHLPNLYQTGHWGKPGCGIWNVMANAYSTSKIILEKL